MADKVYLQPINVKYCEAIIKKERPDGICTSFGGQTGLNVAVELHEAGILDKYNIKVLGTPIKAIEATEDRDLFVKAMAEADCPCCKSKAVNNYKDAKAMAEELGFPLMVRVAYVLGGKGSSIIHNWEQFERVAKRGLAQSRIHQILVEESVWGWKEIEFEILRDAEDNCFINCSMENVNYNYYALHQFGQQEE
jgi:carbamoyl-phosphate synthase large subunit